jgi:hypothetical protein
MAETGKKAVNAEATSVDPSPDIPRRDDELPQTPEESKDAKHKVSTVWPDSSFTVEGVPVITADGTKLTKTQLKTAEEAAEASGVSLTVEDVK